MTATEETGPAADLGEEILAYLDGAGEEALPPAPAEEDMTRHALRVAIKELRLKDAQGNRNTARELALDDFRAARLRGTPQQEVLLPDGTNLGLISIKQGGTTYHVDESELLLLVASTIPSELEDFVADRALRDPRVLEVLLREVPDVVERRIRPKFRQELGKEIEERGGYVVNPKTGDLDDLVRVADVTRLKPTGEFSYSPKKDKLSALRAALEAGLITEDGEIVAPPKPAAAAPKEAPARPAPPAPAGRTLALTPEQDAIGTAFDDGDSAIVEARAGSGKTFILKNLGQRIKGRGLYMVYNRANADEARGKFPRNVRVSTAHGVAKAAVGRPYQERISKKGHQPARQVAEILGINQPTILAGTKIAPAVLARIVLQTLKGWCLSPDPEPTIAHMPGAAGLEAEPVQQALAAAVLPYVRKAWDDIKATDGVLKFEHDYYLKMWQLTKPTLPYDVVLWDEVQDADPVVLDVMLRYSGLLMPVGDPFQAIYGWRGAVNAMDHFPDLTRLALSQTFRFGPAIAAQANKWLTLLDADPLIRGYDRISSVVRPLELPDAVLCRTNAEATAQAMRFLEAGHETAIVGGGDPIRRLAEGAIELKQGRGTSHPELFAFKTWGEVQDYADNDPGGSDLAVFVRLIESHGPEAIVAMTDKLTDEKHAQVTVCTMHKSKGLEYDSVLIGSDFHPPKRDPLHPELPVLPDDLLMLGYVAVTRARLSLDTTNVEWLNDYLPAGAS